MSATNKLRTKINGHLLYLLYKFWPPLIPYTYILIVSITETTDLPSTNTIGLVVGLPLGVLLAVAFLITTVAVVIAVHVQLSRKKEKMPVAEYKVVVPPQLLPGPCRSHHYSY